MAGLLTNLGSPVVVFIVVLLQQHTHFAQAVPCATNPCQLVPGTFDPTTGYNCIEVPYSNRIDAVCTCPNGIQAVLNAPCRTGTNPIPTGCTLPCANGGVCNIVNNQQVCWCGLGYAGTFCEIQGLAQTRCFAGLCLTGTCFEQTIGASTHAYCRCLPGYTGINCNFCYFTCQAPGIFPDTAYCSLGRYFSCAQAGVAPTLAQCPNGQQFSPTTRQCTAAYRC